MSASNESIKRSIQKIAFVGRIKTVSFLDCFVTKVYEEDSEDYGTIDVVTITHKTTIKNVSLSALSDNKRGNIKLPTLLSEVTVALVNGSSGYVVEYTHIDSEIIDVNKSVTISAVGHEDLGDDEDYDEAKVDGTKATTKYVPGAIVTEVSDDSDNNSTLNYNIATADLKESRLTDYNSGNETSVLQSSEAIKMVTGDSELMQQKTKTDITSKKITLSNGGATQNAVLGVALKTVMNAFIDQVAAITTTTSIGPQPIINMAMVTQLKTQVENILSSVNYLE